jgi:hypothetical protein
LSASASAATAGNYDLSLSNVDSEPKPDLENPHEEEKRPKDLDLEPEPEPEPDAEQRKMCVITSRVNTLLWVSNADRAADLLPTWTVGASLPSSVPHQSLKPWAFATPSTNTLLGRILLASHFL